MQLLLSLQTDRSPSTKMQVAIASPHQFVIDRQQQLLGWDTAVSYLILTLQQSSVALNQSTGEVILEKDRLRIKFLRFGSSLVFALRDLGYPSDLFDPRTGYPLIARSSIAFDDNAAVAAILNYEKIKAEKCTLLVHPLWQHRVYPGTIVTAAPFEDIEFQLKRTMTNCGWQF